MLTIQPNVLNNKNNTAFKSKNDDYQSKKYENLQTDLEDNHDKFEELAKKKDTPDKLKTIYKTTAVIASAAAVGVGAGWGLRQLIDFGKKLNNSSFVRSIKRHLKASKDFIVDTCKTIKKKFLESDAYKLPANAIKKQYNKFAQTKFGKPIANFFSSVKKGIKYVGKKIKERCKHIYNNIKGIDKKKVEDTTVNIVGASSGVATGINTIKKKDEENAKKELFDNSEIVENETYDDKDDRIDEDDN